MLFIASDTGSGMSWRSLKLLLFVIVIVIVVVVVIVIITVDECHLNMSCQH